MFVIYFVLIHLALLIKAWIRHSIHNITFDVIFLHFSGVFRENIKIQVLYPYHYVHSSYQNMIEIKSLLSIIKYWLTKKNPLYILIRINQTTWKQQLKASTIRNIFLHIFLSKHAIKRNLYWGANWVADIHAFYIRTSTYGPEDQLLLMSMLTVTLWRG